MAFRYKLLAACLVDRPNNRRRLNADVRPCADHTQDIIKRLFTLLASVDPPVIAKIVFLFLPILVIGKKLEQRGIQTCGALQKLSVAALQSWLGGQKMAESLWKGCRGIDDRAVLG